MLFTSYTYMSYITCYYNTVWALAGFIDSYSKPEFVYYVHTHAYTHIQCHTCTHTHTHTRTHTQVQRERDELYSRFVKAIHEVQQKSGFKNLLLEKKLTALADTLEKKEAQLNEVLSASNLDPSALTMVTRKLEVGTPKIDFVTGQSCELLILP